MNSPESTVDDCMDFILLSSTSADDLSKKVNEKIAHGYKIHGSTLVKGGVFAQTVIKTKPTTSTNTKMTKELWDRFMRITEE